MKLIDDLIRNLPNGEVVEVRIGLHWTAVVVKLGGEVRCGLATTLIKPHEHNGEPDIYNAGELETYTGLELASLVNSGCPTLASVGVAAINALLPRKPELWRDQNAEEVIITHGAGKMVALIGRFPFIPRVRKKVGKLIVIEQDPRPGEIQSKKAEEVLPNADVIAITGMTLINQTLEDLLKLCSPKSIVLVLGPSTPLSPVLFEYGVDLLSGSIVTRINPVLQTLMQGGNFRQVHRAGVRLVTMNSPLM